MSDQVIALDLAGRGGVVRLRRCAMDRAQRTHYEAIANPLRTHLNRILIAPGRICPGEATFWRIASEPISQSRAGARNADPWRGRTHLALRFVVRILTFYFPMIVLIDNYDSFTYNLVQKLGEVSPQTRLEVFRNDKVTIDQIEDLKPTHIVISPGPCTPRETGISNDVVRHFAPKVPLLGVCLGHQCIGFTAGAVIERADKLMHGKTDQIHHDGKRIYEGMPNPFTATRYHSLIIRRDTIPADYEVVAWTADDEIMGIRHKHWPLEGVQYHPESFLTEQGEVLLANFLRM